MSKIYYVLDQNGEFPSEDGSMRYRELRGQALYDYLQSEEGRKKLFDRMVDDEGNEIGIELHNEDIRRQYAKERRRKCYLERMIEEDELTFLPYGKNGTEVDEESIIDESADIEAKLFEAVLIKEVRIVFDRLTEEEQTLLEALVMGENRITTTAYGQIKGIPQQTVCYRKNALLKKLKKLLDEVW